MREGKYFFMLISFLLLTTSVWGQSTDFSYQLILESKGEYTDLDSKSLINPNNKMNIEEFTAVSRLYPIFRLGYDQEKLNSLLQVEGNLTDYNFSGDSIRFTFQELYLQLGVNDIHYISFGKKRLDWGTGMLWNPTNFYIQKDPLRTQNRLEGIFQATYKLLLSNGSLQAYIFPERQMKDFSYALKYDYYGSRIDASLSFLQYGRYQQIGLDLSYGGNIFTAYMEGVLRNYSKSYRVGEDGELIIPSTAKDKFWTEVVAGFSIVCNAHVSLRGEYRFRKDYLNRKQVGYFKSYLPANTQIYDPISIGKHSLFGSMEWKEIYDRFFIQMRVFYDTASTQLILSPLLIWKISNFQIELSSMLYNNGLPLFDYQGSLLVSWHF